MPDTFDQAVSDCRQLLNRIDKDKLDEDADKDYVDQARLIVAAAEAVSNVNNYRAYDWEEDVIADFEKMIDRNIELLDATSPRLYDLALIQSLKKARSSQFEQNPPRRTYNLRKRESKD